MNISQEVLADIPSSIAQVNASDESEMIINDDEFLMMGPIEGHVAKVLENIMVWMAHHMDIAMTRASRRAKSPQCVLGVGGIAGKCLLNLLVDDDIDLDSSFGCPLDDLVQPPFLVEEGRASQEQLGREPPILDVNGLFCTFKTNRHGPHVVAAVDIPLNLVTVTLRKEGLKPMGFTDCSPFTVGFLLVLLVVAMVSVDQILELAYFALEVGSFDFDVVELGICRVSLICPDGLSSKANL